MSNSTADLQWARDFFIRSRLNGRPVSCRRKNACKSLSRTKFLASSLVGQQLALDRKFTPAFTAQLDRGIECLRLLKAVDRLSPSKRGISALAKTQEDKNFREADSQHQPQKQLLTSRRPVKHLRLVCSLRSRASR